MNEKTKKMTTVAMLCALAYGVMFFFRLSIFPAASYLKYDPKDIVITIAGFLFGPLTTVTISIIVSTLEMVTVSESGPIGMIMNVLATCAFAGTAAFIYKKNRKMWGATIGLICGVILLTIVMLLWNYFLTPIYLGFPRNEVQKMLIPIFLPFNLIKGSINAAVTLILYKPIVTALRKAQLIPASPNEDLDEDKPTTFVASLRKMNPAIIIVSLFVLISCILYILVLNGII